MAASQTPPWKLLSALALLVSSSVGCGPGGEPPPPQAPRSLEGAARRLTAEGLPSGPSTRAGGLPVVVTSSADFAVGGNLESGVEVPGDQISRVALEQGIERWSATTPLPSVLSQPAAIASAGRIYVTGGCDDPTGSGCTDPANHLSSGVRYAPVAPDGSLGSFSVTSGFAGPRYQHGLAAYDGWLYLVGGSDGTTELADVQVARLNADGSVGPWSTTTALPAGRASHSVEVWDGRLYVIGGRSAGGAEAGVLSATIRPDGTLGAWSTAGALLQARAGHGSAVWDGRLFVAGGDEAAPLAAVEVARFLSDGSLGPSRALTPLPEGRALHAVFAEQGHLYAVGGHTGAAPAADQAVLVAAIGEGGDLGPWRESTPLSATRSRAGRAAWAGRLYLLGGYGEAAGASSVEYASIDGTGQLEGFAVTTPVPTARQFHGYATARDQLYVAGGCSVDVNCSDGNVLSDVWYAPIQPDGSVGAYAQANGFATARWGHTVTVEGDWFYVLGGRAGVVGASPPDYYDSVEMAYVNPDGSLGTFTSTSAFSGPRYQHVTFARRGRMYLLGGHDGSAFFDDVQMADISPLDGTLGPWTSAGTLPVALRGHAAVVHGDRLYLLGGFDGATNRSDVWVATFASDGTLGPFAATTAMPAGRRSHRAVAHNGYLYVFGGYDGSFLSDSSRAPIRADGTLGAWQAVASPGAMAGQGVVVHDGRVFVTAGDGPGLPTFSDQTLSSAILSDGGLGSWETRTSLPTTLVGAASVSVGDRLYVVGGHDGAYTSAVYGSRVTEDGTLEGWSQVGSLGGPRGYHGAAVSGGRLYVVGGRDATASLATVEFAEVHADGSLGPFTTTGSMPVERKSLGLVALGGRLYAIGGRDAGDVDLTQVHVATPAADGTISGWTATTPLPSGRYRLDAVGHGDRIYAIGGYDGSYLAEVLVADVNADGSLGAWRRTSDLPVRTSAYGAEVSNGYLYVTGGYDYYGTGGYRPEVYVAPIRSDGGLGLWTPTRTLPQTYTRHATAVHGNWLFVLGGQPDGVVTSTVLAARIFAPAARARYSRVIDFGQNVNLGALTAGATGSDAGVLALSYRTAVEGGEFSAATDAGPLDAGLATPLAGTAVRYLRFTLELDDRQAVTVDPGATNRRTVTDVTIDYTPVPEPTRLVFATTATPVGAGACSEVLTVEARDDADVPTAPSGDLVLQLGSSSATMQFFSDAGCTQPVSSVTLPAGDTSASFRFTDTTAGSPVVTATDASAVLAQAGQPQSVVPAAAARLVFSAQPPATVSAGALFGGAVTVQDAHGNPVTGYASPVVVQISPGTGTAGASLSGSTSVVPVGGVATFTDLAVTTAGSGYTLDAASGALTGATSTGFDVLPLAPDHLVFVTGPYTVPAGGCSPVLTVESRDAYGNPAPALSELTLVLESDAPTTSLHPDASCAGAVTSVSLAAGASRAGFHFSDDRAGTPTVGVHDAGGTMPTVSAQQTVVPASASRLAFRIQPSEVRAGEIIAPAVEVVVEDAHGNRVDAASRVSLALGADPTGQAALSGTTASDALAGVARFADLRVDRVGGGYTLVAASAGLTPAESAPFDVLAGPAARIVFTSAPSTVAAGACSPALTVELQDAGGNPAPAGADVTLLLSSDAGTTAFGTEAACSATVDRLVVPAGRADASFHVTDTAAGVRVLSVSDDAGTLSPDSRSLTVEPGPSHHLRISPVDTQAPACDRVQVDVQVVDAYDNPAPSPIEVTLAASSPAGSAVITDATLVGAGPLPAASVTGTTGADGAAAVSVSLDAEARLELDWSSAALPGDPDQSGPAAVDFVRGAPDPATSLLVAGGTRVAAGSGTVDVTVTPRDGCGLDLGAGHTVELDSTFGELTPVVDVGDGTYTSTFRTAAGQCPTDPAQLTATVDGTVLDGRLEIVSECMVVDPGSPVSPTEAEVEACAALGTFVALTVVPVDGEGLPLPPGRELGVRGTAPEVVIGEITEAADPVTGLPTYTIPVGSDRCGTRDVTVVVDGVELETRPRVTFTCPGIEPGGISVDTSTPEVPADGHTPAEVRVALVDRCGNPGFGREVTLTADEPELSVQVAPASQATADLLGEPDDGSALFALTSHLAGTTDVTVAVDGARSTAPELVRFGLGDVLGMDLRPADAEGVVGQTVTFTATLENRYSRDLVEVVLTPGMDGLALVAADGAVERADGFVVERIAPEETAAVTLTARLGVAPRTATLALDAAYGADGTDERASAHAEPVHVGVGGHTTADGCECGSAGGTSFLAWLWPLALLLGRRRRRRPRGSSREA